MQEQIQRAIEILKNGGLVAYPTDTVYGLGADCRNEAAVERVFEVKGRPRRLAVPLLLADVSQMENVAESLPEIAWRLAQRFWPGGLTLVLHKASWVNSLLSGGANKIAVRVPDHPVPIALIRGLGAPITGTSANIMVNANGPVLDQSYEQTADSGNSIGTSFAEEVDGFIH